MQETNKLKYIYWQKKAISCSFVIDKQHLFRFRRNGFHAQLRFTCLLFLQGLVDLQGTHFFITCLVNLL